MPIDLEMNGYEESSIQDVINKVNPHQHAVSKYVTYENALSFINRTLSEDKEIIAKISEQEFDRKEPTKELFRERMRFYEDLIKTALLTAGLAVYKEGSDGRRSELYDPDELAHRIASEKVGYSVLQDAIDDDSVTDIFCNSYKNIWIMKNGKNYRYDRKFTSESDYENFVKRLLRASGKETNQGENKITDAEFFGNRLNVLNKEICPKGTALSLRQHQEHPITEDNLIEQGVISKEISELLSIIMQSERSFVMGGITGSGKSTTLRALLNKNLKYMDKRVIVVEDTQELFLDVENCVETVTKAGEGKTNVDQKDLVIAALRMRPRIIVIGEIRGPEIFSAVQAAATGHMLITSCHGETSKNILDRLVIGYQEAKPTMSDAMVESVVSSAIDFVFIQDEVNNERKIVTIDQITLDREARRFEIRPIAVYNFQTKDWDFVNLITEETQYNMLRRGIEPERLSALNEMMQKKIDAQKKAETAE